MQAFLDIFDIYLLEAVINGILLGGVLALLALGLNLIFGVIDVTWICYAELVKRIRGSGLTVLIVEQNVQQVLRVVDRAYLLEAGTIRASGTSNEMMDNETIKQAYLGV